MVSSGELRLCYDARIFSEYKEALLRPKFSFNPADVEELLTQIEACGFIVASTPLNSHLPDPNDEPFLEVALVGKTRCLVTGNYKHYPLKKRQGMQVVSPKEFLEIYQRKLWRENKISNGVKKKNPN